MASILASPAVDGLALGRSTRDDAGRPHRAVGSGRGAALPLEQMAIIEAPTGSGKTEAALIWASRLAEAGLVDGLFSPSNSLGGHRTPRAGRCDMSAAHPDLRGKVMRAIPGALETDDGTLTTWALGSTRKAMSAPIAVGSIDQALLSQVKNARLDALAVARAASSRHRRGPRVRHLHRRADARLVQEHVRAGGYVLAMSATLGEAFAREVGEPAVSAFAQAVAPRLSARHLWTTRDAGDNRGSERQRPH